MSPSRRTALALSMAAVLAACTSDPPTPTPSPTGTEAPTGPWTSFSLRTSSGSVPPPHNYAWTMSWDPKDPITARVVWTAMAPKGGEDQEWTADFTPRADRLQAVYDAAQHLLDAPRRKGPPPVGGASWTLTLGETTLDSLDLAEDKTGEDLFAAVRDVVPDSSMDDLQATYEKWEKANS